MNKMDKLLSVLMLLSISLTGCKANETKSEDTQQEEAVTRGVHTGAIHISSEDQFNALVSKGNVLVDFYSPSCGPCKQLSPVIDTLAQELPAVTFLKVNVSQFGALMNQYGIRSVPTLIFVKNGSQVQTLIGSRSKNDLFVQLTNAFGL